MLQGCVRGRQWRTGEGGMDWTGLDMAWHGCTKLPCLVSPTHYIYEAT